MYNVPNLAGLSQYEAAWLYFVSDIKNERNRASADNECKGVWSIWSSAISQSLAVCCNMEWVELVYMCAHVDLH